MGALHVRVSALRARLERALASGDPSSVLDAGLLAEAQRLAGDLTGDPGEHEARRLLGRLHWLRWQALPEEENAQDLRASVMMFLPCFLDAGSEDIPEPLLPVIVREAAYVAAAWQEQVLSLFHYALASRVCRTWMALARWPARWGQLRSLVRIFHDLSWAFARSPGPRRRAWERLAVFWESGLSRPL